jgi:Fe-S-cluster-containing dehydrogenase component
MTNQVSTIEFQKSGALEFYADLCVGCGSCMLMCSFYQEGVVSPSLARLRMVRDPLNAEYRANICQQCLAPSCYVACPARDEALRIDEETGLYRL